MAPPPNAGRFRAAERRQNVAWGVSPRIGCESKMQSPGGATEVRYGDCVSPARAGGAPAPQSPPHCPPMLVLPTMDSEPALTPNRGSSTPVDKLDGLLLSAFGHESFRPLQEEVCRAVTAGADVLLVMPTGAGKSLCYQLPGLARGGTTLVLSPLIALMEDQVAALAARGLAAERIHSGRDRLEITVGVQTLSRWRAGFSLRRSGTARGSRLPGDAGARGRRS